MGLSGRDDHHRLCAVDIDINHYDLHDNLSHAWLVRLQGQDHHDDHQHRPSKSSSHNDDDNDSSPHGEQLGGIPFHDLCALGSFRVVRRSYDHNLHHSRFAYGPHANVKHRSLDHSLTGLTGNNDVYAAQTQAEMQAEVVLDWAVH